MFKFQEIHQYTTHRTSWLWWLGFGMKLMFFENRFGLKKGWKRCSYDYKDIESVQVHRRFFRGTTLVLMTKYKPVYFRMTGRQARKAQLLLEAQIAHKKN